MLRLTREHIAGSRKNSGSDKDGDVWQIWYQLFHERQILCSIIFRGHMDLQERDVHVAQIIMISLCGITDKQFTLWIVVLQPILQGSTDEATSDNSYVNHDFLF